MTLEQEAIAREKAIALVNAKIGLQVEDLQDVINVISDAIERALHDPIPPVRMAEMTEALRGTEKCLYQAVSECEELRAQLQAQSEDTERLIAERDHWKSLAQIMCRQFEELTRPEKWDNPYLKVEPTSAK